MQTTKIKKCKTLTEEARLQRFFGDLDKVFLELPNPFEPRMKTYPLALEGLKLITVDRYEDERGCFSDHWHEEKFKEVTCHSIFKQDSYVRSNRGVVRGLHYQVAPYQQGKLVRCIYGKIQDVIVDLRKSSKTFGQWTQVYLDGESRHYEMLWIPPGFAHGYCVIGDRADVLYKMTEIHSPEHERTLLWNDPDLAIPWEQSNKIPWNKTQKPILSFKDETGIPFKDAEVFV